MSGTSVRFDKDVKELLNQLHNKGYVQTRIVNEGVRLFAAKHGHEVAREQPNPAMQKAVGEFLEIADSVELKRLLDQIKHAIEQSKRNRELDSYRALAARPAKMVNRK